MKPKYHEPNPDRVPLDFYPTPAPFTEVLLRHHQFEGPILEPCCGDGAMVRILKKYPSRAYRVMASDLVDYGFRCTKRDAFSYKEADDVVTNPPYNCVNELTRHFLKIARGQVALLVRQSFLESQDRYRIFKDCPPSTVLIISDRMPNSQFGHCWVIWDEKPIREGVIRSPQVTRLHWVTTKPGL